MATEHGSETGFETEQEYVETEDGTRRRLAFVDRFPEAARTARICLWIAFAAFGVGALFGLIQALHRTNTLRIIPSADYYTILTGHGVLLALVFTSFFMSLMFPTIFALSIKGLGPLAKSGSSLLIMAIIGGAIITALMGLVSDLTRINVAVGVPLVCFLVVAAFARRTLRGAQ